MFRFSCSALSVPGTVAMFPVCPTQVCRDAALPVLEIQRAGIHPCGVGPKGSSFTPFLSGPMKEKYCRTEQDMAASIGC